MQEILNIHLTVQFMFSIIPDLKQLTCEDAINFNK